MNDCVPPLPGGFLARMKALLGKDFPAFLSSYEQDARKAYRLRRKDSLPFSADPVPWAASGFYILPGETPGAHLLHETGAYYIQEASAMIPAAVLSPAPHELVLDLCAAPGGKSTQLAQMMQDTGTLVCNEPMPGRARILSQNIERMGFSNAIVTCEYPKALAEKWPLAFDKILVDAPCSGEGMFRRHPETRLEWTEDAPIRCAERQLAILDAAAIMLKSGGRLVYSTCTFSKEENEGVMAGFLSRHPDFSLRPFSLRGLPESKDGTLRFYPHKHEGDGHFAALLQKDGAAEETVPISPPALSVSACVREALDALGLPALSPNALFMNRLVRTPEHLLPLHSISVLRLGLHIGEERKGNFFPDHALSHAADISKTIELNGEDAAKYLHGEVLPCLPELSGFVVLTRLGYPLGFGKAVQGQIKNHYPRGLRK